MSILRNIERRSVVKSAVLVWAVVWVIPMSALHAQSGSSNGGPTSQHDDVELVFSALELDQTNRGTISINGYDRHFSVTFPTSYDSSVAYPVVLFFHGCMCRPDFTEESILGYLDVSLFREKTGGSSAGRERRRARHVDVARRSGVGA